MKRYKLIACEIMFREICHCAAKSKSIVDIAFITKGLHDIGEEAMKAQLQQEINQVDAEKYDAILLCYGLCNNGILDLIAPLPLVVPRAHDCITLLMGSKEKYRKYFDENPGTYFKSTGWIERDINPIQTQNSTMHKMGIDKTMEQYIEEYGEENAAFLFEMCGNWLGNYRQLTYIDTRVGEFNCYKEMIRQDAAQKQWIYDEIPGDVRLIQHLLDGEWNQEDFLVVPPSYRVRPTYDNDIIKADPPVNSVLHNS